MKKLVVLFSAAFLMGANALWAQENDAQTDQSTSGSSQTDQSTSQSQSQSQQGQQGMMQNWTGTLVDASCRETNPSASCLPTAATTRFGLVTPDGKFYKLDSSSASKAQTAYNQAGQELVTVTGQLQDDTITAQSISPQPSSQQSGNASQAGTSTQQSQSNMQTWSGKLVDANCWQANPGSQCPSSASTSQFGLVTADGKFYALDTASSEKLRSALETHRAAENATVTGTLTGTGTIAANSIMLQAAGAGNAAYPQAGQAGQAGQEQTLTGTLYDAVCREQNPQGTCAVSAQTTTFGLLTPDGKFYKFDQSANSKIQSAIQNAPAGTTGPMRASVTGMVQGDTITVSSINIM